MIRVFVLLILLILLSGCGVARPPDSMTISVYHDHQDWSSESRPVVGTGVGTSFTWEF